MARRLETQAFFGSKGLDLVTPGKDGSSAVLGMRFAGTVGNPIVTAENELPGKANYLVGKKSAWITGVPNFRLVRYSGVYRGVDVVFYGNAKALEHDYLVAPHADPSFIQLEFSEAAHLHLLPNGDLEITGRDGAAVLLRKPVAYQKQGDSRIAVSAAFKVHHGQVSFEIGTYDHSRELIIDPVISFSTFLGGSSYDRVRAVATDAAGNIYLTGTTASTDFPVQNPYQASCNSCSTPGNQPDAFVTKLDPTGSTLIFSTYLGGDRDEAGSAIAVDSNGNTVVAGYTVSQNFPVAGNFNSQSTPINGIAEFVTSLSPNGSSLNYSGKLGGGAFFQTRERLALDAQGNAYLTGNTDSASFPITAGTLGTTPPGYPYSSMYVSKIASTGELVYSTVVSPTTPPASSSDRFQPQAIRVTASGEAIIAGNAAPGLPTTAGVIQPTFQGSPYPSATNGFLLKINSTASALVFSTYLPKAQSAMALAVDGNGNSYITGNTNSADFPVTANAYQKTVQGGANCFCNFAYLLKVDSTASSILAASYLTGTTASSNIGTLFTSMELDGDSNVMLSGATASDDFPLVNPLQSDHHFASVAQWSVIAQMNADLSDLRFSSFLGGTMGADVAAVTVDPNNHPIVVGTTFSSDFPTTPGSWQPTFPPQSPFTIYDQSFILKMDLTVPAPSVCPSVRTVAFGNVLVNTSSTKTFDVRNCGNTDFTVSAITTPVASVTPSHNCTAIAPGASCTITATFLPTDTNPFNDFLTLHSNAAIPTDKIAISGKGGMPQVDFFPGQVPMGDLLVGTTGSEVGIGILNSGDGALFVQSALATGDFIVSRNTCTGPVLPDAFCSIFVKFSPTAAGVRSGTLAVTDNAPGSPRTAQLTGNGLTTYPVPVITNIFAVPVTPGTASISVSGDKFFPPSTVQWGGSTRSTVFGNNRLVIGQLASGDAAAMGEVPVTVNTGPPGGGTSAPFNVTVYGRMTQIQLLDAVYSPRYGLIYGTVSSLSSQSPNSVVAIDPAAMQVVSSWPLGNSPTKIAISDDSQFLYVGLNASFEVAQLSLPSGNVNFKVDLGVDGSQNPLFANSIAVLPGHPGSYVVNLCANFFPCGVGVQVFDGVTSRGRYMESQLNLDSMVFVGSDAGRLYATQKTIFPPTFFRFSITATGITKDAEVQNFSGPSPGGGDLDSDGTKIYVSNGQVIDPATLTIVNTVPLANGISFGGKVDVPAGRIYFASRSGSVLELGAYRLADSQKLGSFQMRESPVNAKVLRWGTNGLAIASQSGLLLFRTSLTGISPNAPDLLIAGANGVSPAASVPAGTAATFNLQVIPQNGAAGVVTFTCDNLPQFAACSITPPSAMLGSGPMNVAVSISTSRTTVAQASESFGQRMSALSTFVGITFLPLIFTIPSMRKHLRARFFVILVLAAFVLLSVACGGGGAGGTTTQPPPPTSQPSTQNTPKGTYVVLFTATGGGVSRSINLNLTVQ